MTATVTATIPYQSHQSESPRSNPTLSIDNSIESWLRGTIDGKLTTSSSLNKRKRSDPTIAPATPPPHISETFLGLEEIEFEMPTKDPATPDPKAKGSNLSDDQSWIKQRLSYHRMFQNDKDAFKSYPDFKAQALAIIGGERSSVPRPESIKKFETRLDYTSLANEDTFLDYIMPILIPEERTMPAQHDAFPASNLSSRIKDFWESGVYHAKNVNCRSGLLPEDPELAAKMRKNKDKEEGQTNPKPDYIYGLRTNHFKVPSGVSLSAATELLRQVVPSLYDPMLIIEGKSDKGQVGEAINQACRGGATAVKAARMMRERIGQPDVEGPDRRTFLFSGTLTSSVMHIWVHWAEVKYVEKVGPAVKQPSSAKGKEEEVANPPNQSHEGPQGAGKGKPQMIKIVNYHMNMIATASLLMDEFLEYMRPICLNILDWGCLDRVSSNLQQYYQDIYAWEMKPVTTSDSPASKRARTES